MVRRKKNISGTEKFLVHFRHLRLAFCRESFPLISREQISGWGVCCSGSGTWLLSSLIESSQALFPHFSAGKGGGGGVLKLNLLETARSVTSDKRRLPFSRGKKCFHQSVSLAKLGAGLSLWRTKAFSSKWRSHTPNTTSRTILKFLLPLLKILSLSSSLNSRLFDAESTGFLEYWGVCWKEHRYLVTNRVVL